MIEKDSNQVNTNQFDHKKDSSSNFGHQKQLGTSRLKEQSRMADLTKSVALLFFWIFFSKKNYFFLLKREAKEKRTMQDCSILDTQADESSTEWVQRLHKKDILTTWSMNECIYFLLLSPTTQKKVGGFGMGNTDGELRLMVVQRITILSSLSGNDYVGTMPYRTPRGLGQVYGEYETVRRVLLADFCTRINHTYSNDNSPPPRRGRRRVDTSAEAINNAVQQAMFHLNPQDDE